MLNRQDLEHKVDYNVDWLFKYFLFQNNKHKNENNLHDKVHI